MGLEKKLERAKHLISVDSEESLQVRTSSTSFLHFDFVISLCRVSEITFFNTRPRDKRSTGRRLIPIVFTNMSGNYKFAMDQKDIVRFLTTAVGSFSQDRMINKEQRIQHKEQCAERLAAEDSSYDKDAEVRYSDQAVLANLDWGIDALEEAINTSNIETKLARLDHAEKMLQVCAMLNSSQKTAGVPNFYLSAWAHLNLSFLWKLRNNVHNSVLHVLEMFIIDPFFSRIDFAPELWKSLFLPHMSSIVGWYSEARYRLVMEVIPDSTDLSFTADFDQFFNESLVFSMRPDQAEKMQKLEQLYGESLDENTRLYAKYYKDCMNFDSTANKKVIPMFPIAEPPMTPLHELSRSIPDYVKFGPILPKSAGFSSFLKDKDDAKETCRLNVSTTSSQKLEESAVWGPKESLLEENKDDSDSEYDDPYVDSEVNTLKLVSINNMQMNEDMGSGSIVQLTEKKDQIHSPINFSPMDSPKTPSPKVLSPNLNVRCKKEPQTVLRLLSGRLKDHTISTSLPASPRLCNDSIISSADSDGALIELQKNCKKNLSYMQTTSFGNLISQGSENSSLNGSEEEGSRSGISLPSSEKLTPRTRPPKDFVCPITGQLFGDPVTLETGQTYERKAIQEWLKRGNTTCPITRQLLSATGLPKTNYVLKRLITSWKEQYPDLAQELSYSETPRTSVGTPSSRELTLESTLSAAFNLPISQNTDDYIHKRSKRFMRAAVSTSPTSVISQAAVETVINGLKPYISCLCTSEDLQECEAAVLTVARILKGSKDDSGIHSFLSKPTIVNGFVEILSASVNREVLRTSIYILSELIFADENVGETLTSVDSDFDCLAALLKNGLAEAAILIYQLRPAFAQLSAHDLVPSLVQVILNKNEDLDDFRLVMEPKDAAIAMLEQVLMGGDENSRSLNAMNVISANGLPSLIKCLDRVEVRQSIVSILLCCIHADRSCRNLIANRAELAPVLELFHTGNDSVRGICIDFLSELVCLNRRTFCNQILQIIKDEGAFSTMHALLVYLQMAPMEQQPAIATLLLQLDLLVEPRKMSIYREEAIEALIEALRRKDFPISQIMALEAFTSLSGRLTASGKSLTEAWLLKIAGLDQPYDSLMKAARLKVQENESIETMEEEEKAASSWEKRVAFVLCNHENGSIFKALEECLKSNSLEMTKSCLVIATWLTHMLNSLPDTGVRYTARKSLLDQFINVLLSSKNLEEKVLATLALKSFVNDSGARKELGMHATSIYKPLRKLKRNSVVVTEILKALMNLSSVNPAELWSCSVLADIDSGPNGEILSLVHLKGLVFSSHSDGTIKVWDAGKRVLRLIQEVREHTKAVTCLYVQSAGDKMYSGSLDKTIRVWAIKPEEIRCVQVHDMKDAVHELAVNANLACFSCQGTGVKVYNWGGVPKHINFNKSVKCLAMEDGKLYCGCTGYSIQEVDLHKCTSSTFFSGTRKLLGKQTMHSLHIRDGLLFAGGSSVDGIAGKVFSLSTKEVLGSLSTGFDIHCLAVNNDFIFTGTKCGIIEVWLRERFVRVASIKMGGGGNTKITSLTSDSDGEMLFAGSSDGKIQAWALD
ncbi:hypothetical protein HHK36_002970 [Tetracentron sinense]|uniref:RING-type E3 ubiquitin transferase n=1 Tax=Tetracentron sinense TaxID=13715 RepID=A0A834ZNE9_TETSI|nr:hypothetical protein HHK36_002970 [Tetracentron sinense]